MNSGDNLKISELLQQRMVKAVSEAFGVGSLARAVGQLRPSLTLASVLEVKNRLLSVFYRVDDLTPEDEFWLVSAGKRVVQIHPKAEAQFVDGVRREGFVPVALDLDNEAHRMLWAEAWAIAGRPVIAKRPSCCVLLICNADPLP